MVFGFGLSLTAINTLSAVQRAINILTEAGPGAWYDPSDLTTLFQDSAGTTPVTAVEQPVGRILDKSGGGNHAIQPTATSRPTLSSRYNLLTKTEQFDDVYWAKGSATVTANATTAPDGTTTADSLIEAAATASPYIGRAAAGLPVTSDTFFFSLYVKANGRNQVCLSFYGGAANKYITAVYDLSTGTVSKTQAGSSGTITSTSITASGSGWYRIVMSGNTAAPAQMQAYVYPTNSTTPTIDQYGTPLAYTGGGTSGLFIWGASLTTAADASRPYQRVNTATDYDYDFSKFPAYLKFDGVDDSLYSAASVDFNGAPADGQTKRNLLSASEAFDDAIWVKLNVTATAGKVSETAVTGVFIAYQSVMPGAGTYTFAVEAKAAERSRIALEYASSTPFAVFDLSTGVVQSFGSSTATITSLGGGWYRCTMTATLAAGSTSAVGVRDNAGNRSYAGSAGSGVLVRGAQLEVGSSATAYQKTGTDKMTVFAGVHKASDAATGVVSELSGDANSNNGSFFLLAPRSGSDNASAFASKGTTLVLAPGNSTPAPTTKVVSVVGDISSPKVEIRLNGVSQYSTDGSQGTGNYGNYPLYVGRRNNASLPFNGRIYQLAIKGKALSAAEISTVESFVNSKTKAFV